MVVAHVLIAAIFVVVVPECAALPVPEEAVGAQRAQLPKAEKIEVEAADERLRNPRLREELLEGIVLRRPVTECVAAFGHKVPFRVVKHRLEFHVASVRVSRILGEADVREDEHGFDAIVREDEESRAADGGLLPLFRIAEGLPTLPKKPHPESKGQPAFAALEAARLEIVQHVTHLDLATCAAITESIKLLQLPKGGLRGGLEHSEKLPVSRFAAGAHDGFRRTAPGLGSGQVLQHFPFTISSERFGCKHGLRNVQLSTLNYESEMEPLRVAFLGKSASRGGSQRELSYIVKHLDKDRFQATILLPEGGDLLGDFERSAPTHVYSGSETTAQERSPNRLLQVLRRKAHETRPQVSGREAHQREWALELINAFRPNVIVRQYHFPIPHFDLIETLDIPSVQSVLLYGAAFAHVGDEELRRLIKRSQAFVCPGKKVRDYIHGCWGVPTDRIATICIGLDLTIRDEQMNDPRRVRRGDIGLDDDTVVVATSGSFHYLKGADVWVETAAILRARYPAKKLKFMWIGGSEGQRTRTLYGSAVVSLVQELGLTADVIFAGDQQQIYPFLDACDIYVQPSRDDAFPHATLEAMAVGKPVVSFPEGVAREPYAQNALVRVDDFSAEALADGVARLIDAPALRHELGEAGLEVIRMHFDVAASVRRFEEILTKTARPNNPQMTQMGAD